MAHYILSGFPRDTLTALALDGKLLAVDVPLENPSFEALTGTPRIHFNAAGHLRNGHFSQFSGGAFPQSFITPNAIPGWTYFGQGGAGTWNIDEGFLDQPNPDGQHMGWVNEIGRFQQVTTHKIQPGRKYTLTVAIAGLKSVANSGYFIRVYARNTTIIEDNNTYSLVPGIFTDTGLNFSVEPRSAFVDKPMMIELGTIRATGGQTDFDHVRLTYSETGLRLADVKNPGFEDITGTDARYFDAQGKLRDNRFSQFSDSSTLNAFDTTIAIPNWQYFGEGGAGTWNVPATSFPAEAPEGRNTAWINFGNRSGEIRQTLPNERITAGYRYRLSVFVGLPLGVTFPGFRIELRAGNALLASRASVLPSPHGTFQLASVEFTPEISSPFLGQPLQIVLGNGPTGVSGHIDFDDVRLEVYSGPASVLSFEPQPGVFTNLVTVFLNDTPGNAVTIYTLDGSEPTPLNGFEYTGGFSLAATTTVRARSFINRQPTGPIASAQYIREFVFDDVIPAAWREKYFGTFYRFDANARAEADLDGDGSNNLREFAAGTNPLDGRSGFAISIERIPLIKWYAIPGTFYAVERRRRLQADWQFIESIFADRVNMTFADESQTDGDAFYRVVPVQ